MISSKRNVLKIPLESKKSKLIFSVLQRKSTNNSSGTSYNNQPFRGSPLPRFSASGGRGHFFRAASHRGKKNYSCIRKSSNKAGFEACASSSTKSFSSGAEVRPTSSRQIDTFSEKLEKIDQRPSNFGISGRLSNPVFIRTKANEIANSVHLTKKEEFLVALEIQAMLRKDAIRQVEKSQFLSPIFLVEKKDSGYRPVINLKKRNQKIPYIHFKIKGLSLLKKLLQKGDFLCKLDLKDAYFAVALHKISRKYLRFPWQGNLYQFLCLCFGLGPAPRIFTKLMKIPITLVRRLNVRLIIYLDDILVMGSSLEEIMMSRDTLIFVLQDLGFVINFQKPVLNPSHQIQFLGIEIDSLSMIVFLPIQKKEQIISQCQDLLNQSDVSLRQMTQLIGRLSSTAIAVLPAPLQYRSLQRQQILELAEKKSFSARVVLSKEVREEIQWWI